MANHSRKIERAYDNHGESANGRVFTHGQFERAVQDILDEIEEDGYGGDAVIDAMGRIYVDGNHVGWVKRDAGLVELKALASAMSCNLPSLDAMVELTEIKS